MMSNTKSLYECMNVWICLLEKISLNILINGIKKEQLKTALAEQCSVFGVHSWISLLLRIQISIPLNAMCSVMKVLNQHTEVWIGEQVLQTRSVWERALEFSLF